MSIFQSSEVAEGLWAEWVIDTPMCRTVGQIPAKLSHYGWLILSRQWGEMVNLKIRSSAEKLCSGQSLKTSNWQLAATSN
jgi:hypothetical protein